MERSPNLVNKVIEKEFASLNITLPKITINKKRTRHINETHCIGMHLAYYYCRFKINAIYTCKSFQK